MNVGTGSALQQLADDRLQGRLRERVEELRRAGKPWREVAATVSEEAGLGIATSTLHTWAAWGGWDVDAPAGKPAGVAS